MLRLCDLIQSSAKLIYLSSENRGCASCKTDALLALEFIARAAKRGGGLGAMGLSAPGRVGGCIRLRNATASAVSLGLSGVPRRRHSSPINLSISCLLQRYALRRSDYFR